MLAKWSAGLLQSPQALEAIENILASDFSGFSPQTLQSRLVRPGPAIEIRQNQFSPQSLGRDVFLQELRSSMASFSKIATAEFQIVAIEAFPAQNPGRLHTRVRYEIVGSGRDFHREQRVGEWELEWISSTPSASDASAPAFQLKSWQALGETRSRSTDPVFVDIAAQAFAGNPSYSSQLLQEPTTGVRFLMSPAVLTSTDTTASQSAISTMTDSTTFTFASRPVFPIGFIETAATAPLRTSRKHPE